MLVQQESQTCVVGLNREDAGGHAQVRLARDQRGSALHGQQVHAQRGMSGIAGP